MIFLAVDPGTQKCGLAVVNDQAVVLKKMVILSDILIETIKSLLREYDLAGIVIGDRTNSKKIFQQLTCFHLSLVTVDENNSSFEGRRRYLQAHSKGIFRLIPIGLRIPSEPYDDYVAVILAERFLKLKMQFHKNTIE